ncbi:MAG: AI-2E family transporter [Acetobacteraceae bacterium]|nr:AI-2E family transporter [Acetobacteraceae bacterium]
MMDTQALSPAPPDPPHEPPGGRARDSGEAAFLRRVLIVAAVAALALLLWAVRGALLLLFGAVVVAVLLLSAARPFRDRLRLPHGAALAAGGVSILAVLALATWLVGSQVRAQVEELAQRLPDAARALESRFGIELPDLSRKEGQDAAAEAAASRAADGGGGGGGGLRDAIPGLSEIGVAVGRIAAFGVVVLDALSALLLAVVGAVYLAADPAGHRRGAVALLPKAQQRRVEEFLEAAGNALNGWLLATLASMAAVGVMVGLGAWALGLPAALALGLFAALAEIVPVVGPVIGAVPALLLAVGAGFGTLAWTAALFLAVQQVEANLLHPLLQKRMADVPPVLLLLSVVAVGTVFGIGGLVLAAPITVVAFVAVQKFYVRETLGNPAEVPGENVRA